MTQTNTDHIISIVTNTVARSRERGLGSHEQSKEAVNAVRTVRPDIGASEVQRLVERVMVEQDSCR